MILVSAMAQHGSGVTQELDRMGGPQILRCAASPDCKYDIFDLANALHKRFTVRQLIAMYPHEVDQAQEIIVISLMKKKSAAVVALMREAAFAHLKPGMTDEDNHYFSLQYLADRCDPDALRELNRPANFSDSYPVGCMFWQNMLRGFGKCSYRPSIPHLAVSLNSACLNNTQAAEDSLRHLLPKSLCWKKAGLHGDFREETACYLKQVESSVGH
jgi:hypothetical protein